MMTRKDYVQTSNILKGFADEIHPQVYEQISNNTYTIIFIALNLFYTKRRKK